MNVRTLFYWPLVLISIPLSCWQDSLAANICPKTTGKRVCVVPFEAVYFDRDKLFNKRIAIDGLLLVGARGEFPHVPVTLLFASVEKAQVCNYQLAIEIIPDSNVSFEELKNYNGEIVNVSGVLRPSVNGHWAALELTHEPATLMASGAEFATCLKIPPPFPDPSSQGHQNNQKPRASQKSGAGHPHKKGT